MGAIPSLVKLVFADLSKQQKTLFVRRLAKFTVTHDHGRPPRDFLTGKGIKGMLGGGCLFPCYNWMW